MNEGGLATYLGVPECFSGSKVELLQFISDRVQAKMRGWYPRHLSQGGKEILLKSIALAMPIHIMSCFLLPKTTCTRLSSVLADFWWNSSENQNKIHWLSWEKLCLPKARGGMGFKNIEIFNQALLAKQAWRLLSKPNSLFSSFMKSRYYSNGNFLEATAGNRPSYAWRSILRGRDLLVQGLEKRLGNGNETKVWSDPWIKDIRPRTPLLKDFSCNMDLKVSDVWSNVYQTWNRPLLQDLFFQQDIDIILKSSLHPQIEDFLVWKYNRSGDFSVKSGYWLMSSFTNNQSLQNSYLLPSIVDLKVQVWSLLTENKIKIFIWKLLSNALPAADSLERRHLQVENSCSRCGRRSETLNHILFECPEARLLSSLADYPCPELGSDQGTVFSNVHHLLSNYHNSQWPVHIRKSFPWILWRLWKNRNNKLFQGLAYDPLDTLKKVREDQEEWNSAQLLSEAYDRQTTKVKDVWTRPKKNWYKCNIASSFCPATSIAGAAWVLRNEEGIVILHSRRSFAEVSSASEAAFTVIKWAIQCIVDHRLNNVSFECNEKYLSGSINRPHAWPSFKVQSQILLSILQQTESWDFGHCSKRGNKPATLIARSVTRDLRTQSYIARGPPKWLDQAFQHDRALSSHV